MVDASAQTRSGLLEICDETGFPDGQDEALLLSVDPMHA